MRVLVLLAGLLLAPALAAAQGPIPRKPAGVPSIMVGGDAPRAAPRRSSRRDAARRTPRRTATQTFVAPRMGASSAEGQIGAINRSLGLQQQRLQIQQQNQFETNQLRQEIQRNQLSPIGGGSLGCPAGSIGC